MWHFSVKAIQAPVIIEDTTKKTNSNDCRYGVPGPQRGWCQRVLKNSGRNPVFAPCCRRWSPLYIWMASDPLYRKLNTLRATTLALQLHILPVCEPFLWLVPPINKSMVLPLRVVETNQERSIGSTWTRISWTQHCRSLEIEDRSSLQPWIWPTFSVTSIIISQRVEFDCWDRAFSTVASNGPNTVTLTAKIRDIQLVTSYYCEI